MKRRTKIVCTLGPAVDSREKIGQLAAAGMNVARINCSHGDWETRRHHIEWVRQFSTPIAPIAVLADLQGPKFRIGELPEGVIEVQTGQTLSLSQHGDTRLQVPADEIFHAMAKNDRLLLGDGEVELKLIAHEGDVFQARVLSSGKIKSRQGITLVGRSFNVPSMSEKDLEDIFEACKAGVDFIALSYVRQAADLRELRRLVDKYEPGIKLCAKIETREALKNIDEILKVADLVMVARGDLGLQMDLEDVPTAQKRIIHKANLVGRPVITATQMLESMVNAARPTRAEATDVFNAILDGTDAVMLSGETAAGMYPIEAVKTMARITEKAEALFDYDERLRDDSFIPKGAHEGTEAVARAAVELATSLRCRAIVTTSTSGLTPRMVSKFRPRCPILCASWNEKTHHQLGVVWGVEALRINLPDNMDATIDAAINAFLKQKRLKVGDTVVVTAGVPAGTAGNTNLILVHKVD